MSISGLLITVLTVSIVVAFLSSVILRLHNVVEKNPVKLLSGKARLLFVLWGLAAWLQFGSYVHLLDAKSSSAESSVATQVFAKMLERFPASIQASPATNLCEKLNLHKIQVQFYGLSNENEKLATKALCTCQIGLLTQKNRDALEHQIAHSKYPEALMKGFAKDGAGLMAICKN